jgi:stage V sporulation protein SpoVS
LAIEVMIATPAEFGGMKGEQNRPMIIILDLHDSLCAKPVVTMYHIEVCPLEGLCLPHKIDKTIAHIIHLRYEIRMQVYGAAMIMDAVNQAVCSLTLAETRKYMDLVSLSLQRSSYLGHVDCDASDRNRVQAFPCIKRYSHLSIFP